MFRAHKAQYMANTLEIRVGKKKYLIKRQGLVVHGICVGDPNKDPARRAE